MYDCQSLQYIYNYKFHVMPLTYHRPPFHVNVFKLLGFDMEVGGMGYSYCHTSFSTFFCRPSFSILLLRR